MYLLKYIYSMYRLDIYFYVCQCGHIQRDLLKILYIHLNKYTGQLFTVMERVPDSQLGSISVF